MKGRLYWLSLLNLVACQTRHTEVPCSGPSSPTATQLLGTGVGRSFRSPNYPDLYPHQASCKWKFESAPECSLSFTCRDFNIASETGSVPCIGDYLRFFDGIDLNERFCNNTATPSFRYKGPINVTFKTNRIRQDRGFDCSVTCAPDSLQPTPTPPPSSTCITVGGPGKGNSCVAFKYKNNTYDGCINRRRPDKHFTLVPDALDGDDQEELFEDDEEGVGNDVEGQDYTEGGIVTRRKRPGRRPGKRPGRRPGKRPGRRPARKPGRNPKRIFWCATSVNSEGIVQDWGKCPSGCKADPTGSFIPYGRGNQLIPAAKGKTVGDVNKIINKRNKRTIRRVG